MQNFKSIEELEAERFEWSIKIFPEATALSSLNKLKTEIKEIEADLKEDIKNPSEYADALMCLFDSAGRYGITIGAIFDAFEVKLAINKARKWVKNPDNSYSHVKSAKELLEMELSGITRDQLVPHYAELIRCKVSDVDISLINQRIINRWSIPGLIYIKEQAWKEVEKCI